MELTGEVVSKEMPSGTKQDGKAWKKIKFAIGVFDPESLRGKQVTLGAFMKLEDDIFVSPFKRFDVGDVVKVSYDDKNVGDITHHNIISMVKVEQPVTSTEVSSSESPKFLNDISRQKGIQLGQAMNQALAVVNVKHVGKVVSGSATVSTEFIPGEEGESYRALVRWFYENNESLRKELLEGD